VFGRLAGYEDVNDTDRLGRDPAMRWIVGDRAVTQQAASTSQMGRFETSAMTSATNLTAPADLSGRRIDRAQIQRARTALVLDIDSSVRGRKPLGDVPDPRAGGKSCLRHPEGWSNETRSPVPSASPAVSSIRRPSMAARLLPFPS